MVSVLQSVVDIEESVWAPRYGIKGSIDASFRVGLAPEHQQQPQRQHQWQARAAGVGLAGVEQLMVPFEFKTGRPHLSHGAQVPAFIPLETSRGLPVAACDVLALCGWRPTCEDAPLIRCCVACAGRCRCICC